MSGFSADWLRLREPYDRRARNPAVLTAVSAGFTPGSAIAVVDLACGIGASLRALAPILPRRQNWRLVDNDLSLLARIETNVASADAAVSAVPLDLTRDLEIALDGPLDLITTSAFLDLVSADWLERFVIEAAARALPIYAALTYDGRFCIEPEDPLDGAIIDALNRHQARDKGFGPALGPRAAPTAERLLQRVGYALEAGLSDWQLGPSDQEIQLELVAGLAAAAREMGAVALPDLIAWVTRRRGIILAGGSSMQVGHCDIFARMTGTRWGDRSQSNSTSSPIE
jgi:SAM-dependent methyltransferase